MAQNEALGKAPSVADEIAKFQSFAVKDGEVFDGSQTSQADERAKAEAAEKAAGAINNRSHSDNMKAGTTSTDGAKAAVKEEEIKLTEEEEEAALQTLVAKGRNPDSLTQEEMHKAIDDALAAKKAEAAKAAAGKDGKTGKTREQRNADRYDANHRRALAAERRADDLQRQIDEIKAGKVPLTEGAKDSKQGELVEPDPKDAKYQYGELDPKYIADLAKYQTLKALDDRNQQNSTKQQTEADKQAAAEFKARVEKFAEDAEAEYPDFQEAVMDTLRLPKDDPDFWPLGPALGELILESKFGHQIAYELASDPKEAKRINKLSDARQAIWFGTREAEISAGSAATDNGKGASQEAGKQSRTADTGKAQAQPKESKAPIPLRTRLTGAGGNRIPNSATTDFAAFEAMTKQVRK